MASDHSSGGCGTLSARTASSVSAADEFHDDVSGVAFLAEVVHRYDVGVGKSAGGAGFPHQALAEVVPLGGGPRLAQAHHLDRHRAADGGVDGAVDHAHAAPAQLVHDLVTAYAGHVRGTIIVQGRGAAADFQETSRSLPVLNTWDMH